MSGASTRRATKVVAARPHAELGELFDELALDPPEAVIMLAGGAGSLDTFLDENQAYRAKLELFFDRVLIPAIGSAHALVIDGGTNSGVMAMIGRAMAKRGSGGQLLGVAPDALVRSPRRNANANADRVELEPHHHAIVLTPGSEWGDETDTMFGLADAAIARELADGKPASASGRFRHGRTPAICVLIGGGAIAYSEVVHAVRRGWPVIIVEGSGGLADELTALRYLPVTEHPDRAEVLAEGDLHFVRIDYDLAPVRRLFGEYLDPERHESLLVHAWERFAAYDDGAIRHQHSFDRLQRLILGLGLLAAVGAVAMMEFESMSAADRLATFGEWSHELDRGLYWALILLPLLLSIAMTAAQRFRQGSKWVLMRAAAEAIKREIFLFRTRASPYEPGQARGRDPIFAERLAAIVNRHMTTAVNEDALPAYTGPIPPYRHDDQDDGIADIDANRYLTLRVADQIGYFTRTAAKLQKKLQRLSISIYVIGGLGTLLAAVGMGTWIAVTTAMAAAVTTYMEYQQIEYSLIKYNQTRAELENIHAWWQGLTPSAHTPENFRLLVARVEQTLESEFSGWVQRMQDSLEALRSKQAAKLDEEQKG